MRYFLILLTIISSIMASGIGYLHFFHKQATDRPQEESKDIKSASTVSIASLLDETKKFVLSVIDERLGTPSGVLSLQGEDDHLQLSAGDGLGISLLDLSNIDKGSSQNIFKNIETDSGTITAGNNNDIIRVAAGNGISIATDTKNKKLTISSTVSPTISSSNSFSDITSGASSGNLSIGSAGSLTYYNGSSIPGSINVNFLQGQTWSSPAMIGDITPADAIFSNLAINGVTKFLNLSAGIAQINSSGQLISSFLNLSGNYLTGVLPLSLGGTGATTSSQLRDSLNFGSLALQNNDTTSLTKYLPFSGGILTGDLSLNSSSIRTGANQILNLIPNGTGYTRIGDAGVTNHGLNTNDDLYVSGKMETTGASYFDNDIYLANSKPISSYSPTGIGVTLFKINGGIGDIHFMPDITTPSIANIYFAYNTNRPFYFGAGPNQPSKISFSSSAEVNFQISSSTIAQVTSSGLTIANDKNLIINNGNITTDSNSNLSIVPNGTGYTRIGDAGVTNHGLNTNDDLLVTGRFEVNNQSYFNNNLLVSGASLCVKSTASACAGNTAGTLYASNTTVQSADVAENYISSQQLESGDVVMPDKSSGQAVIKTSEQNQSAVIGVVSSRPGVTLNSDAKTDSEHPYLYPIALNGRVPVRVSTENGNIVVGDLLTTSSAPGVAMKATKNGTFIGKALQEYNGNGVGKIMIFVTLSSTLPSDIALESPSSSYDLSSLQSQISSLSAQILSLPDISKIFPRLTSLESQVSSLSAAKNQFNLSGDGTIQKGQTEVKITNNNITDKSRILLTATSMTDKPLVIREKIPGGSFTAAIISSASADISFNWLILNN